MSKAVTKKTSQQKTQGNRGGKKIKYPKVDLGKIFIKATFNNTIISLARQNGDILKQITPAQLNYRHCKKNTPSAVQEALIETSKIAIDCFGMKRADVILNGPGIARDMVNFLGIHRGAGSTPLHIESITDTTSVPHGGCRPRRAAKK